jgi:DNA/RNA endonuclease G (NUC1)
MGQILTHSSCFTESGQEPSFDRNTQVIAWIIPNAQEATQTRLDQYLVSIQELEDRTGKPFPRCQPR